MKIELCVCACERSCIPIKFKMHLCVKIWKLEWGNGASSSKYYAWNGKLVNRGMYSTAENRPLENHSMKTQSFGNCFFSTSFQIGKKNTWAFEISHGSLTRELNLTLCLPVFALSQLQQCIAVSRKASEKIFQFYRDSVRRRYSKMLEWGACDAFILFILLFFFFNPCI